MAGRFHPKSTPRENLRILLRMVPWRMYLVSILLIALALPTFLYGIHIGGNVFFNTTHFFYELSAPPMASPTPPPPLPQVLPQVGPILYTVRDGDSCDGMLAYQMRMNQAGEVFSDVKPETVRALSAALGQDCRNLKVGTVVGLSPQYPLVALGGTVMNITALQPHQVIPTPLIHVHSTEPEGPDCSQGCALTVQIAPQVTVRLAVQTALTIREGSWVWAQAMMARKKVARFDAYPYVENATTLNGMSLRACDFQVDDVHDTNAFSCSQLQPNTIDADGGSWLFAVTGAGALDHWQYPIHLPPNTRVLLWLSDENGTLIYHRGDPLYRYDDNTHTYQKLR
jgi:hypothetical protein